MVKLRKLNNQGTLGVSIPKSVISATSMAEGDDFVVEIKSVKPLVLALLRVEKIEW